MTKRYPYTADILAAILLTILAIALILVSQSGPEGSPTAPLIGFPRSTLTGILFLVIAPLLGWQGIRKKPLVKTGFPPKPWFMFGLFWFWLLLALVQADTLGPVQTLMRLLHLVLAVYCLALAIGVKWPSTRPAESA